MTELRTGETFARRYRIERSVRAGVYEAIEPEIGRRVAISILHSNPDGEYPAEAHRRFREETRAAGSNAEPKTATLLDYGDSGEHLYMVFEWPAGRSIDEVLGVGREVRDVGIRELDAEDFGADDSAAPLEIAIDVAPVARSGGPVPTRRPAMRSPPPPPERSSILGFAALLVVGLLAVSAVLIWHFDLELPTEKPEPVSPASLQPRVFSPADPDTRVFYVDLYRGMVLTRDVRQVAAMGRCATGLDSIADPAPDGVYYLAELVDYEGGPVSASPVGRDALVEHATVCSDGGEAAEHVAITAELLVSEKRLAELERAQEKRSNVRKRQSRATSRSGARSSSDRKKKKLMKMLLEQGTGIPTQLLPD